MPEPTQISGRTELIEIMQTHHGQTSIDAKMIVGQEGTQQGALCGLVRLGLTNDTRGTMRKRLSSMQREAVYEEFRSVTPTDHPTHQTMKNINLKERIMQHHEGSICIGGSGMAS